MPERIQLRRTKGWRKPEGAVVVARPTKWGNPFVVRGTVTRARAVEAFRDHLATTPDGSYADGGDRSAYPTGAEIRAELAGKDLACWCPLEDEHGNRVPCHADVLLEIANRGDGQ